MSFFTCSRLCLPSETSLSVASASMPFLMGLHTEIGVVEGGARRQGGGVDGQARQGVGREGRGVNEGRDLWGRRGLEIRRRMSVGDVWASGHAGRGRRRD